MLSRLVSEIQIFPVFFGRHFRLVIIIGIAYKYNLGARRGRKLGFVVGILMTCYTFGDISTSGLGGHIAISGRPSSSKLLSLKSSWSVLSGSQSKRNKFDFFLSKRLGVFYPPPKRNTYV